MERVGVAVRIPSRALNPSPPGPLSPPPPEELNPPPPGAVNPPPADPNGADGAFDDPAPGSPPEPPEPVCPPIAPANPACPPAAMEVGDGVNVCVGVLVGT